MTLPLPPHSSEPVPSRRRWGRVVLLVLLVGIGALGWRVFTYQRAVRQLREAGFVRYPEKDSWLGARLWAAARDDWRELFRAQTWEAQEVVWNFEGHAADRPRNLDAVASSLRRINPEYLILDQCSALQNVDGLKGLTALRGLSLDQCSALQNVDGLKGVTALRELSLLACPALQNLDGLKGLRFLEDLDISQSHALENMAALRSLSGLRHLCLNDCPTLRNLEDIKRLTSLESLELSVCDALHDLNGIEGLHALETLELQGCSNLANLDGLTGLKSLEKLDLGYCTKLPPKQVQALKAALPGATIEEP